MIIEGHYDTVDRIRELKTNLKKLKHYKDNNIQPEFKKVGFITPITIMPIASYLHRHDLTCSFCGGVEKDHGFRYLKTIKFPNGLNEVLGSDSYIPITNLSRDSLLDEEAVVCVDDKDLIDYANKVISKVPVEYRKQFGNQLFLSTIEIVNNVLEHSEVNEYRILAQVYSEKVCELCIVDFGVGFKKSYQKKGFSINSDKAAIINAINGISCTGKDNKGRGISGLIEFFVQTWGGEMIIASGNSLVFLSRESNKVVPKIVNLEDFNWGGSLVWLKFPVKCLGQTINI